MEFIVVKYKDGRERLLTSKQFDKESNESGFPESALVYHYKAELKQVQIVTSKGYVKAEISDNVK